MEIPAFIGLQNLIPNVYKNSFYEVFILTQHNLAVKFRFYHFKVVLEKRKRKYIFYVKIQILLKASQQAHRSYFTPRM